MRLIASINATLRMQTQALALVPEAKEGYSCPKTIDFAAGLKRYVQEACDSLQPESYGLFAALDGQEEARVQPAQLSLCPDGACTCKMQ